MKGLKVIIMTTLYKMSIENKNNGELFVKNYNTRSEVIAEILTLWKKPHNSEAFVHNTIKVNDLLIESYVSELEDEDWIIRVYKTNERVKYRFDYMVNDFYENDMAIVAYYTGSYTLFNREYYTHFNVPEVHVYENTYGDIVIKISHVDYRSKYGNIDKIIVVDYLLRFERNENYELVNDDNEYVERHYVLNSDLEKYKQVRIFNMKG